MSKEIIDQAIKAAALSFDMDSDISVAHVAETAFRLIEPEKTIPTMIKFCAITHLHQRARKFLSRHEQECKDNQPGQDEMFDILQDRYTVVRHGDIVSIPRTSMTEAEYMIHEHRLRKEGVAKIDHADALNSERIKIYGGKQA